MPRLEGSVFQDVGTARASPRGANQPGVSGEFKTTHRALSPGIAREGEVGLSGALRRRAHHQSGFWQESDGSLKGEMEEFNEGTEVGTW